MPVPAALIAGVVGAGVVQTIAGFIGSRKAAKGAKKEAEQEAAYERMVTDERLRQLGIEERVLFGETIAGYASGGVQARAPGLEQTRTQVGSPMSVISEQTREFAAERQITRDVGASRVQQSLTRGKNVANQYKWTGYANVASSISNILGNYAGMKYGS
jgi:hypothetical protein